MTKLNELSVRGTANLLSGLIFVLCNACLFLWFGDYFISVLILSLGILYYLLIHKKVDFKADFIVVYPRISFPFNALVLTYNRIKSVRWDSAVAGIGSRVVITYIEKGIKDRKTTFHCSRKEWRQMVTFVTERDKSIEIIDN